ncbi:MAG: PilZ domain-containing protein [Treponema sp.]|jgi:hypothetical protein|nr:PilZ domain-containing protein [Treponema sp.]
MYLRFPRISFYLLQDNYFKEDDPRAAVVLGIIVLVIILVSLIVKLVRPKIKGSSGYRKTKEPAAGKKFSSFTLRRLVKPYGLNKDQIKILDFVFKNNGVNDPERVLANSEVLDKHFKRAFRYIERAAETEEEAQKQMAVLFSVRNSIEAVKNTNVTGAPQVSENMSAVFTLGGEGYPVRIVSTKGNNILVTTPVNARGIPIKINNGAKGSLSFFTKANQAFVCEAQVVGATKTSKGAALELARLGKPKGLMQRRFKRRQIGSRCAYQIVTLEESGSKRRKELKMQVDPRRFSGNLIDLSIGGCAITTSGSINAGTRLKIEFDHENSAKIAVLGQVLRLNRGRSGNATMHIKFTKVPRRAANSINATVFEYNKD